jgi:hypothetical protein
MTDLHVSRVCSSDSGEEERSSGGSIRGASAAGGGGVWVAERLVDGQRRGFHLRGVQVRHGVSGRGEREQQCGQIRVGHQPPICVPARDRFTDDSCQRRSRTPWGPHRKGGARSQSQDAARSKNLSLGWLELCIIFMPTRPEVRLVLRLSMPAAAPSSLFTVNRSVCTVSPDAMLVNEETIGDGPIGRELARRLWTADVPLLQC